MARPKRDNNLAAQALAWAFIYDDVQACAKYDIARRTLQNYRKSLETDKELARTFHKYLNELTRRSWADEMNDAIKEMLASIQSSFRSLESSTGDWNEQLSVQKLKIDFFKAMVEPSLAREVMLGESDATEQTRELQAQV